MTVTGSQSESFQTREEKLAFIKHVLVNADIGSTEDEKDEFLKIVNLLDEQLLQEMYLEAVEFSEGRSPSIGERATVLEHMQHILSVVSLVMSRDSVVDRYGESLTKMAEDINLLARIHNTLKLIPENARGYERRIILAVINSFGLDDVALQEFDDKAGQLFDSLVKAAGKLRVAKELKEEARNLLKNPFGMWEA